MRKVLVVYLVAEPETPELARVAVEAGADIVELGFPFSDPLADGPVIQRAECARTGASTVSPRPASWWATRRSSR